MAKELKSVYMDFKEYHDAWAAMKTSRENEIIHAVNCGVPKEEFDFKNEAESKYYDYLVKEADAYEEYGGKRPIFEVGEIETDDPKLDIYNEPV